MKRPSKPDRQAAEEAEPGPVQVTPRRLANQVQSLGAELAGMRVRFLALAPFLAVDNNTVPSSEHADLASDLDCLTRDLVNYAARIRVGDVPLEPRLADDSSWRQRLPLIAAIEDRNGQTALSPPSSVNARESTALPTTGESPPDHLWLVIPKGQETPAYATAAPTEAEAEAWLRSSPDGNVPYGAGKRLRPDDGSAARLGLWVTGPGRPKREDLPGHLLIVAKQVPVTGGFAEEEPKKAPGKPRAKRPGKKAVASANGSGGEGGPL